MGTAEHRRLDTSQSGLSCLLASLRWFVDLHWSRFLIRVVYLLPLTAVFLLLALGTMWFRTKERRGYGPFLVGIAAASGVLIGKFVWESSPAMYSAVGLLVISPLWNACPRRDKPGEARTCSLCNTEKVERNI
jgi:hypothetical protein